MIVNDTINSTIVNPRWFRLLFIPLIYLHLQLARHIRHRLELRILQIEVRAA